MKQIHEMRSSCFGKDILDELISLAERDQRIRSELHGFAGISDGFYFSRICDEMNKDRWEIYHNMMLVCWASGYFDMETAFDR